MSGTGEFIDVLGDASVSLWPNGTLSVSRAERRHEGRYICQASNSVGAGLSKVVNLYVHGKLNSTNSL